MAVTNILENTHHPPTDPAWRTAGGGVADSIGGQCADDTRPRGLVFVAGAKAMILEDASNLEKYKKILPNVPVRLPPI